MADTSSTFLNKKISNNTNSRARERMAMDRAERRQRLASETAEELEARLHHGGELVEGSVLHRAPHADTGRSLTSS